MNKQKLINHLKKDVYCRVGISKVSGVGVIAIKDIPKGTDPFKSLNAPKEKAIKLTDDDMKGVDKNVVKMIKDFFGSGDQGESDVLHFGPNYLSISFYMNHSDKSNMKIVDKKGYEYLRFETKIPIKKGEELYINYNDYKGM